MHTPINLLIILLITLLASNTVYAQSYTDIAYNAETSNVKPEGNRTTHISEASIEDKNIKDAVYFTSIDDVTLGSYFDLSNYTIKPYMIIQNSLESFNQKVIRSHENVSLNFKYKTIEFTTNGINYIFQIENIQQYSNTSELSLIKSKIEIEITPLILNNEKVSAISVYTDKNAHISFIELGSSEYYLRP